MNPRNAKKLPILAAMNIRPLRRRRGLVVHRAKVEGVLRQIQLETNPLPSGELLNAEEVERILAESGISVELVRHRTVAFLMLSPEELLILAEKMVAATDPKEVRRLKEELVRGFYGRPKE